MTRSTVYYQPQPESPETLALMRRIDELHMDWPFAGARMLSRLLKRANDLLASSDTQSLSFNKLTTDFCI